MQEQEIDQRAKEIQAQIEQLDREVDEILKGCTGAVPKEWFWALSARELLTNKILALSGLPPLGEDIMRMDFGQALRALKAGRRVSRAGWNGKGMWLAYTPGSEFAPEHAKPGHAAAHRAAEAPHEPVSACCRISTCVPPTAPW